MVAIPASRLVEFLPIYPSVTDPNLSGKLADLAEFNITRSPAVEEPPEPGQPFNHQRLFERLYTVYDNALVMDAPGTGKSCLVGALTEHLKVQYQKRRNSLLQMGTYSKAYILGTGDIIIKNFKNELACRCTRGVYDKLTNVNATARSRDQQLNKVISEYYSLQTYVVFAKSIRNMNDAQLIQNFNGSTFFFDEAHNLISQADQRYADTAQRRQRGRENETLNMQEVYNVLHRLVHVLPRCKVVCITATPARGNARLDFGRLLNLLKPLDQQLSLQEMNSLTPETFKEVAKGYLMYVREADTGVDVVFEGEVLGDLIGNDYVTIVSTAVMGDFQLEGYRRVSESQKNSKFYIPVRQASNMVFPDGSNGKEGFSRYVQKTSQRGRWEFKPEMLSDIREAKRQYGNNFIYKYSCKFAKCYDLITENYKLKRKGSIYEEYKSGSGVIALSLLLEQAGIERFYSNKSVFPATSSTNRTLCASSNSRNSEPVGITKALRFGLLLPENPGTVNRYMLELFNSPANMYGEYIIALLFSPFGNEGISFDSVQWEAENPSWLWPSAKQSIYRGIRTTSHIGLLRRLRAETGNPDERIKVSVHRLASLPPTTEDFALDIYIYAEAERHALENAPFVLASRTRTNNCYLAYERNVRPGDENLNGKAQCDYTLCTYDCDSALPSGEIDYSGLLANYSDEYLQYLISYFKNLFSKTSILSIDDIVLNSGLPQPLLLVNLSTLIKTYQRFLDRYGFLSYVKMSSGYLYLSPEYPGDVSSGYSQRTTQGIYALKTVQLDRYIEDYIRENSKTDLEVLSRPREILRYLNSLDTYQLVNTIEDGISALFTKRRDEVKDSVLKILEAYKVRIFRFRPADVLPEFEDEYHHSPEFQIPDLKNVNFIYVHSLNSNNAGKNKYASSTESVKPKNLRILYPIMGENKKWHDANKLEQNVFSVAIKRTVVNREKNIRENPIYGTLFDGEFRIVNNLKYSGRQKINNPTKESLRVNGKEAVIDGRTRARGRNCISYNKVDLIDSLWNVRVPFDIIPASDQEILQLVRNNGKMSKTPDLIDREGNPTEKASYFYSVFNTPGTTVPALCGILEEFMKEQGLLAVR
jgi:hypothetical protein